MTQHALIVGAFRRNGNCLTLGQILQHSWGYEARARFSEMRRLGFAFELRRGKRASDNEYRMREPFQVEENGQEVWL